MELEQWRRHEEQGSDHHDQPSATLPKLQLLDQQQPPASSFGLALFTPHQPNDSSCSSKILSLSPFPDSTSTRSAPRMDCYFSLAQWQELELQALIYKYMLAGIPVPMELILPIRKSLLTGIPYYHQPHHFPSPMMQGGGGYWGRCVIDPEPGRCRRTDGKKWRCSREVMSGHKYCERHVHRGRNRSRKHVEIPTPAASGVGLRTNFTAQLMVKDKDTGLMLSGSSPGLGVVPLNQRFPGSKTFGVIPNGYSSNFTTKELQDDKKSKSRILRRFFDDWPRSHDEPDNNINTATNDTGPETSTTHLSMSICSNSSDFSLKLCTGNCENKPGITCRNSGDELHPTNWSGWVNNGEALMGGPLAEALRSSASTPSPTSVLHKLNGSVSETSSITI